MKKSVSVGCNRDGCGKTWPRDPVLEVPCPTCKAPVGTKCTVNRPSQHKHSMMFAGKNEWGHDERDILADREGKYGECPLGRCGLKQKSTRQTDELPLFEQEAA